MKRFYFRVLYVLLGVPLVAFLIHNKYRNRGAFNITQKELLWAYVVNVILALLIFSFLFYFRKRFKHLAGFLFMAGSLLKFLVFFLLFYPGYRQDGTISTSEFTSFFIPYALCLVIETVGISKMLAKTN